MKFRGRSPEGRLNEFLTWTDLFVENKLIFQLRFCLKKVYSNISHSIESVAAWKRNVSGAKWVG